MTECYQKKIRLIVAEITALDSAINTMDKEIDDQRANLGGINAASQNNDAIHKQIRVLENRLDKVIAAGIRKLTYRLLSNSIMLWLSIRAYVDRLTTFEENVSSLIIFIANSNENSWNKRSKWRISSKCQMLLMKLGNALL